MLLVFTSCPTPFEQSHSEFIQQPSSVAGMGSFSLNLSEESQERTILPATPSASDFAVFKLEFLSGSTVAKTADRSPANLSEPVMLDTGIYDLHVTAYIDAGKTKPAAWGSLPNILITEGMNTIGSVELAAIKDAGQGTFKWTINFPSPASDITGTVKITPIAGGVERTAALASGTADSLTLNAGYYRVVFTLRNTAYEGAERWEILHIYQNMESAFTYTFENNQFHSYYNIMVTNGNNTGTGSLRQAINDVLSGGTIVVNSSSAPTITLTSQLQIPATKSFTLEGNGVTIQSPSWSSPSAAVIHFISGAAVTISRVHFTSTPARFISNYGNLNIESCVFSNNINTEANGSIIINWTGGTTNIKGSTFYKNSGNGSGAINMQGGTATLTGNLFYGNTATGSNYPIVIPVGGTITSGGYNVVDVPLGSGAGQSGWAGQSTDKVTSNLPVVPATFKLLAGRAAQNVITAKPAGYPAADFYGNLIPASNAAAGAVQAAASGYLVEVSVNDSALGSAAITSAPALNADGLYGSGSVTFTATPKGVAGYSFQYWTVNNQHYTANPLSLTLTDHYTAQAVFGRSLPSSVKRVLFSGPTATVNLSGLSSNSIYLVKVNTSGFNVSAANTGGPSGSSPGIPSGNSLPPPNGTLVPRMGHPLADEYHANPPPVERKPARNRALGSSVAYVVGNTKLFWVESAYGNNTWVQRSATLVKQGTYGNIWVINNVISDTQAQALADKFDAIYPIETSLLGYEYGGGPSGDGGWDNDQKIQILVYDIGYDPAGTTLGYFWAKDMRTDTGSGQRSNQAEMFYLNGNSSVFANFGADQLYSTLVHEFQHMINYSQKTVKHGVNSEAWYNEMLSMLAEDVISPLISIGPTNSGHPIKSRIPTFLSRYYVAGITEWGSSGNTLDSYAIAYSFGAYLLRNYEGATLLKEMLANNSTNINSVTAALRTVTSNSGISFEEALRRFGEAMIFSGTMPSDVLSFDKTVTKTISGNTYTATRFNVWNDFGSIKPTVFNSTQQVNMRPYSLTVHQGTGWTGKTGSYSITLQRPNDMNVEFYLMIK
jgi:hypothetical protein